MGAPEDPRVEQPGKESGIKSENVAENKAESRIEEGEGTPEEALRAAERMTAGPEFNDHGDKAYDARESTGRRATEDWKKGGRP